MARKFSARPLPEFLLAIVVVCFIFWTHAVQNDDGSHRASGQVATSTRVVSLLGNAVKTTVVTEEDRKTLLGKQLTGVSLEVLLFINLIDWHHFLVGVFFVRLFVLRGLILIIVFTTLYKAFRVSTRVACDLKSLCFAIVCIV
jgi:hypothetical protein